MGRARPSMARLAIVLIALVGVVPGVAAQIAGTRSLDGPDVLVIIGDDIAHADVAALMDAGWLPNLDALAARGVSFPRAYAAATCSPARRALLTGLWYAEESGAKCLAPTGAELPLAAVTLAELVRGAGAYPALFGKWHVGANPTGGRWEDAPLVHGFRAWEAGHPDNVNTQCGGVSYFRWLRVDLGRSAISREYEPDAVFGAAAVAWRTTAAPKVFVVAPQLAHAPFHRPPSLPPGYPAPLTPRERYEAMIVALDAYVGRMLALTGPEDLVIFVGDNGTPGDVAPEPDRAKTTTFERGIHVPLIVAGPGFTGGVVDPRLAHIADVFATVAEFVGASVPPGLDALSLRGAATHPEVVCGTPGDVCATTGTVKLRRTDATGESLHDLALDPGETLDLSGDPSYAAIEAHLRAVLDAFQAR
jgi:arylsulfatase A-like enzyme